MRGQAERERDAEKREWAEWGDHRLILEPGRWRGGAGNLGAWETGEGQQVLPLSPRMADKARCSLSHVEFGCEDTCNCLRT